MGFLKKKKKLDEVKEETKEEVPEVPNPPKKEDEPIWILKEFPSQYVDRIYNNETEESLDLNEVMVRILNEIEEIKEFLSE